MSSWGPVHSFGGGGVESKLADIQQCMTRPGIQHLCSMQLRKVPFQCHKMLSLTPYEEVRLVSKLP